MAGRVYVVAGTPGSGKSLLMRLVGKVVEENPGFRAAILQKTTTRRPRGDEGPEILPVRYEGTATLVKTDQLLSFVRTHAQYYSWDRESGELRLSGPMLFEEAQELLHYIGDDRPSKEEVERLYRESNAIDKDCDVVYEQYTRRYGLRTRDIITHLSKGQSAFVIVNDVRAIRELRDAFGPLVVVTFVYRQPADLLTMQAERGAMGANGQPDSAQAERRRRKSQVILRRYIENIELFDHVILNTTDDGSDLLHQLRGIVRKHIAADERTYKATEGLYA